ncbi:GTP-binding protein TypA/BipA [Chlamydiales bacterium SCGC AB-751-O23]|jgi:GTP-binding protein|nr:GTP-binding protein TypA/BipA [Chlamydiales bacterium SCGC AB-751-O23]
MSKASHIRNIAIIAHIDHGKTTILDSLLKQSNIFRENEAVPERAMDSYDQEKERGITIFSKHTMVPYGDYTINLIDTPGHADFSGEVERVLGMVDSVLLLVDAQEGPMPQTRFVLSKALKMGLNPIVVINKIDRPHAKPDRALDLTFDLFVELGANDTQLDFTHIYASGLAGFAKNSIDDPDKDMTPLYEMIIDKCPAPKTVEDQPFLMQVMSISYNDYVGRMATGCIISGEVEPNSPIVCVTPDGKTSNHNITKIEGHYGLKKINLEKATPGNIVTISGVSQVMLGDTLCTTSNIQKLPPITLDEPTVSISLSVNSSPFAGLEGKHVTFNKIKERLAKEKRSNISLRIEECEDLQDTIKIAGRGELHLAVLIEAMRREGFELSLGKPQVLTKEVDGVTCEPVEKAYIEVPEEFSGTIIEELSKRKGQMQHLNITEEGLAQIEFLVPTRGLLGYRNEFITITRGLGVLSTLFDSFVPWKGKIEQRKSAVMVSMCQGRANAYASFTLQDRGDLLCVPGDEIYEGMIVGVCKRDKEMAINLTKAKQLTNVRSSGTDEALTLIPAKKLTLEEAIDFIAEDEMVEVTPKNIRIRKIFLKENERKRTKK